MIDQGVPFKSYVGLDISENNIRYLKECFPSRAVDFVHGDAEFVALDRTFDTVLSSLTLKHLFPTFEAALSNIAKYVNRGGLFLFDLREGESKYIERRLRSSLKCYTRSEILEILSRLSLEHVAFDEVKHTPDTSRLLVVARKS